MQELTELAGHQPVLRELIRLAFVSRLGPIEIGYEFHRGWNGGWRCRATAHGKRPLDFALLRTESEALLALPLPMPSGWKQRGVRDSSGVYWTLGDDDIPETVSDQTGV